MTGRRAAAIAMVGLLLFAGTGYAAWAGQGNGRWKLADLSIVSVEILSGPDSVTLTPLSAPTEQYDGELQGVGPGDTVTVLLTVQNTGSHPVQHLQRNLVVQLPLSGCAVGSTASVVSSLPNNLPIGGTFVNVLEIHIGDGIGACGQGPIITVTLSVAGEFPH